MVVDFLLQSSNKCAILNTNDMETPGQQLQSFSQKNYKKF